MLNAATLCHRVIKRIIIPDKGGTSLANFPEFAEFMFYTRLLSLSFFLSSLSSSQSQFAKTELSL